MSRRYSAGRTIVTAKATNVKYNSNNNLLLLSEIHIKEIQIELSNCYIKENIKKSRNSD